MELFWTGADHLSEVVPFRMEQIGLERFGVCLHTRQWNGSGTVLMPSVNGLLLSLLLTVPPFVELFQQRDDPCGIGFYTLAFLSSDSISESYIQLSGLIQTYLVWLYFSTCITYRNTASRSNRGRMHIQNTHAPYINRQFLILSTSVGSLRLAPIT